MFAIADIFVNHAARRQKPTGNIFRRHGRHGTRHGTREATTLVEVLLRHATERPDATAYVFLREDGAEETLTFGQLARRAQAIAGQLQALTCVGERAILLYQPGLDFIEAILACFFARLVAVPVAPLRNAARAAASGRAFSKTPAPAWCSPTA